eukprot:TRINITY_DN31792_c0_g1_i1.p1 TRINITY_DN31792_c0_g1~~TRINITY_DN31792_c0_g1_i1.p1  ORF type:complete len:1049 (+),score=134.13 TRINITY_DN31792_c0_g1_i1:196-3342(+)
MTDYSVDCARLAKLVEAECPVCLLCVAPAFHLAHDHQSSRRVWLGVAKTATEDYIVFIFARTRLRVLQTFREFVYCVIPVASNIILDIEDKSCIFRWSKLGSHDDHDDHSPGLHGVINDCTINNVDDTGIVFATLQEGYLRACQNGVNFYPNQRDNHTEVWVFRDMIPADLAKLRQRDCMYTTMSAGTRKTTRCTLSAGNELKSLCITWNVGATTPSTEHSLAPLLCEEPEADIVCVGLQEVCELSTARLLADGTEWVDWRDWVQRSVKEAFGGEMAMLSEAHLVGMLMIVFVHRGILDMVTNQRFCTVATGTAGFGNKGAVCVRFELAGIALCFVNVHLAAGQENFLERCRHFRAIRDGILFAPPPSCDGDWDINSGANTSSHILFDASFPRSWHGLASQANTYTLEDHDHIFWLGDTNSRLHWPGQLGVPIAHAEQKIRGGRFAELLPLDQLNLMRADGIAFDGFLEMPIAFMPSYKYSMGEDELIFKSQKHVPAWTDRILFRSTASPAVKGLRYDMYPDLKQSDHRPVYATFAMQCDVVVPHGMVFSNTQSISAPEKVDLILDPGEATFSEVKPDRPFACMVRLSIVRDRPVISVLSPNGKKKALAADSLPHDATMSRTHSGRAAGIVRRFQVFLQMPDGSLEALGYVPPDRRNLDEILASETLGAATTKFNNVLPANNACTQITRWLHARPTAGIVNEMRPIDMVLSLCIRESVTFAEVLQTVLVVRLTTYSRRAGAPLDYPFVLRSFMEPSVFRASLECLARLGKTPLLPSPEAPLTTDMQRPLHPRLPPKEVMCVMMWLLQQCRDAPPRSLKWWIPPQDNNVELQRALEEEICTMQRYVENFWPLPFNHNHLPARSGVMFLVRWLELLPMPIVRTSFDVCDVVQSEKEPRRQCTKESTALQQEVGTRSGMVPRIDRLMSKSLVDHFSPGYKRSSTSQAQAPLINPKDQERTLASGVLVCIVSLFAHLIARHGAPADVVPRLASALSQQTPAAGMVEKNVTRMLEEVDVSKGWPPAAVVETVPVDINDPGPARHKSHGGVSIA